MKTTIRIFSIIITLALLAACTPAPTTLPTPTASAAPAATITPAPTPTPRFEPVPPVIVHETDIFSSLPDFSIDQSQNSGSFDVVDANAVYALYLTQNDRGNWNSEADFVRAMEIYYTNTLASQGIQLVEATVPNRTASVLVKDNHLVLLNFTPEGALKDIEPGQWSPDSTAEWVDAGGPVKPMIGGDGYAYLVRVGLTNGVAYALFNPIGTTLDNIKDQWIPIRDGQPQKAWNPDTLTWEKTYATTEYTGTFSEEYGEPEFTDSFTYTQETSGISVPIHIGLDTDGLPGAEDNLPISEVHLTDLGQELLGELWLAACYYRYTEIMGNDVNMEQYLELVKAGQGQVEAYFIDELTGEKKTGLIDPRNGVSITLTGRSDAPLEPFPANDKYPVHINLSLNSDGQPIIVVQWNQEAFNYNFNLATERGFNDGYFLSRVCMQTMTKGK